VNAVLMKVLVGLFVAPVLVILVALWLLGLVLKRWEQNG